MEGPGHYGERVHGRRGIATLAAVVVVLASLAGCTAPAASRSSAPDDAATHQRFGLPAVAAPKGFTYQPDVVVVGGGRNSVLGGSLDGVTWRFDSAAPGMSDVSVGKILWASSMVVGRVAQLDRGATVTTAVLIPVALNDVIRDGHIAVDTAVDPDHFRFQPGTVTASPSPSTHALGSGTVIRAASDVQRAVGADDLPDVQPATGPKSAELSGFGVTTTFGTAGVTLSADHETDSGLKLFLQADLAWDHPRFFSSTDIVDGDIKDSGTKLAGLKSLTVSLRGGAADPDADNQQFEFDIPGTETLQLDELPPLVIQMKIAFSVKTAFTGKNATLTASGKWKLDGSMGGLGDAFTAPTFAVENSIIDSISGITLGPSGLVFAMSVRALVGLGVPGIAVGPYVKLVTSIGITNGSSLGAPLARCRGATLDFFVVMGGALDVSADLPKIVTSAFGKYIDDLKAKVASVGEKTLPIINRTQVVPDVPVCNASK